MFPFWIGFVLGLVAGVGGYIAYDRWFSTAAIIGRSLLGRVSGDVGKAKDLISKL